MLANFKFLDHGSGGTVIIDPPVDQNTSISNPLSTDTGHPSTNTLVNVSDTAAAPYGSAAPELANTVELNVSQHGEAQEVIPYLAQQFASGNEPSFVFANLSFEHAQDNASGFNHGPGGTFRSRQWHQRRFR